jgi:Flp pilus assembly protein TadD
MKYIALITAILMVTITAATASYEDALKLFDAKNYRESLKLIASELDAKRDAEPSSPNYKLRFLAAHNHWKLGTYESALQHFQRCMQIRPDTADPYVDASIMLIDLKKFHEAEIFIKKGLDIKKDAMLYYVFGKLAFHFDNLPKAKELFEKSISINPELYISYNSLGITLMRLERYSEANTAFTAALSINSSSSEIMNNTGFSLISMGRFDVAVKYLEKAHLINPENVSIKANLDFAKARAKK